MLKLKHGSTLKLLFLLCGIIQDGSSECEQNENSFDYRERGPDAWKTLFPTCNEKRQSPIALDTTNAIVKHSPTLQWFNWHNVPLSMSLENNGHSVMLTASWNSSEEVPYVYLMCSPCTSGWARQYVFGQLHFHWGERDDEGSEHTLNTRVFPLELHMVTHRREFGNVTNAIASGEQTALAVITYFFSISDTQNDALQDMVVSYLSGVKKCGDKVEVDPKKLSDLVPEFNRNFFIYNGTLTTPPCSRVAMFFISKEPQPVRSEQLSPFRCILDASGKPLTKNYRDPQNIDGRKVTLIL